MSQKEDHNKAATELIEKGVGAACNMQKEVADLFKETNRDWLARLDLERELVSELTTKLTAVRSAPEIAAAYQEWMTRRLQLLGGDSKKLAADWQRYANIVIGAFGKGSVGDGDK